MGVAKLLPRSEVLVVTTPALGAQKVASRAVSMARKSYRRVAGVIENMSSFTCEHGESYSLFGEGGGEQLAADAGVPLLGKVPLERSEEHPSELQSLMSNSYGVFCMKNKHTLQQQILHY